MNIGIAAPIEVASLKAHLPNISESDLKLGLGGTAVNILIDGYLKAGHQVTVFTLDRNIKEKRVLVGNNIKIIIGTFRNSLKFKILDFCRVEYLQIKQFIEEEKSNIDIVNAHWSYEFAIGTILAKVPHLITFRDHSQSILKLNKHPYRLSRLFMDLWVRRKGKHFNYNSLYLQKLIGLPGPALPNPIRTSEITEARSFPLNKSKLKICYIANGWGYRKNPENALEAFSLLLESIPNAELHMIGKGYEPESKNYTYTLNKGWDKQVVFRGPMANNDVMLEMKDFDVLLHTAREESFGNNLIEAMAKGIPVIAGDKAGAVPWVLDYGKAGCLTNIESPVKIAEDLSKLLLDKHRYEELSKNGIKNLNNRFTQEIVCEMYVGEYSKIVKQTVI